MTAPLPSAALAPPAPQPAALRAMPLVFVLIWSTGFVVARYGMRHAPPLTFLAWRYALSIAAFGIWVLASRAAWPRGRAQWMHLSVTGVLMHGGYLGGVWCAVAHGLGAGTAALIVGLQPVLTALWTSARGHRHRIGVAQWIGLALGVAGLVMVVWNKLHLGQANALNIALALLALASITVGTLYQKRWVARCDVRSANLVQLGAALIVTLPLALFESGHFDPRPEALGAL
ncbi:MAG: DMT family transporter, partial [Burkholderiales bacterium]|nr:DMT family transporter [Burkholderiales bacterium]